MDREKLLKKNYPCLGQLQIEKILTGYDSGYCWYDYCPETHEVTMVDEEGAFDISVEGDVTPSTNSFTELRG